MYRHPPPRKCPGTFTGLNKNFNCVAFHWAWNGWSCLYCEGLIGAAPHDLPRGSSAEEEEAAAWFRDRYRRLEEWNRRVMLGLETQPWHIGWEPTPLPPSSEGTFSIPQAVHQCRATTHAEIMNNYSSALAMSNMRIQMQHTELQRQETLAKQLDDLTAFLATPAKALLDIPPTPKTHDEQLVEEQTRSTGHPEPMFTTSPLVDSPMEIEQEVQKGMVLDERTSLKVLMPASPLSDLPESPPQSILIDEAKPPWSPTSSAIAALLDDKEPEVRKGKKPKIKLTVPRKKTSSANTGAPKPPRGRPRKVVSDNPGDTQPIKTKSQQKTTPSTKISISIPAKEPSKPEEIKKKAPTKLWHTVRIPKTAAAQQSTQTPTPDCTPTSSPQMVPPSLVN